MVKMSAVCINMARVFNCSVQQYKKNLDLVSLVNNGHFCYVVCYSFLTSLSAYKERGPS